MSDEERGLLKSAVFLALGLTSYAYRDLFDWKDKLLVKGEKEWNEWKGKDQATKDDIEALADKIDGVANKAKALLLKFGDKK
jgi:hypothetical protein